MPARVIPEDDVTTMTITRAASRGYIVLPWPKRQPNLGVGFSTELACTARHDPFLEDSCAFSLEALRMTKLVYHRLDDCNGTFMSSTTTSVHNNSTHLSLALGVSVGNDVLGASVTGSYDKATLDNKSSLKSSRRATFRAGSVHFLKPPELSAAAQTLLAGSDGVAAFTARYGDFYVGGVNLGGDSGVLVSQEIDMSQDLEKIKVVVEAHLLCFSGSDTVAEKDFNQEQASASISITAFDTLDDNFTDLKSTEDQPGMKFDDARKLASAFNNNVQDLPDRVNTRLEALQNILTPKSGVQFDDLQNLLASGVVVQMVLLPYLTIPEVRTYVSRDHLWAGR